MIWWREYRNALDTQDASLRGLPLFFLGGSSTSTSPPSSPDSAGGWAGLALGGRPRLRLG